ncbi:hypothetical protein NDU88_006797 [Pleurodeles waltl]|uniref:Uncharacterized protein n=1 Tax=Pleurodeles waltl TaxID=8319 RepID=A0AAV7SQK8_PLEWA|nr:hypothetical protein NDU88_006797 [Pleurodeles waltl]
MVETGMGRDEELPIPSSYGDICLPRRAQQTKEAHDVASTAPSSAPDRSEGERGLEKPSEVVSPEVTPRKGLDRYNLRTPNLCTGEIERLQFVNLLSEKNVFRRKRGIKKTKEANKERVDGGKLDA